MMRDQTQEALEKFDTVFGRRGRSDRTHHLAGKWSIQSIIVLSAFLALLVRAAALAGGVREEQITAQELAASLEITTRKIVFTFDSPVYARAEIVVMVRGDGSANSTPQTAATSTTEPQVKIPFCYTERDTGETSTRARVLTFQVGNAFNSYTYPMHLGDIASANAHEARPEMKAPSIVDPKRPVYALLYWDPNEEIDPTMPPEKIAGRIKRGYYLVLYFSRTPF